MRFWICFALCCVSLGNTANAQLNDPKCTISHRTFGDLVIFDGKIVFTSARVGKKTWWTKPVSDSKKDGPQYIHPYDSNSYLTANEKGEVYLSEKPEKGSEWGLLLPKFEPEKSWISSSFGRLDVTKTDRVIKDQSDKECPVYDVRVSPLPNSDEGNQPPAFNISGAN